MSDLKFEQKRSLSRQEAADQLTALASALREGGDVELEFGTGMLSLRIPDDLRAEMEVELEDGQIELEIEFTWPAVRNRTGSSRAAESTKKAAGTKAATGTKKAAGRTC
ncbi:amphi-Trp domain-containing protein, partial [Streptomyces sp. NPDC058728]|uniref:amphi-Trp domain-containing protein n=1 Tax=Streptomyces sp. NPDC058728 TaxID=3346612 RepID=UPI00368A2DCB